MKIRINFKPLWDAVKKMGDGEAMSNFTYTANTPKQFETDKNILIRDISLEDVDSKGGVLEVDGSQVLLYIEDHSFRVQDVLSGIKSGNKYHVADCVTLNEMRRKKRFDRYVVTNDVSEIFTISGKSPENNTLIEGKASLSVCKNCLTFLNYRRYKSNRTIVFNEFKLDDFFAHYSTLFESFPKAIADKRGGYTSDWDSISLDYRQQKNYCCEACNVNLSDNRNLLHTHHINGVKRDNSTNNLQALCVDCHRKQPSHEHMRVRSSEVHLINKLRRSQQILSSNNWNDAIAYVDTSYHGLLDIYRSKNKGIPEIGYEVKDYSGSLIATAELAWPQAKRAIVHHKDYYEKLVQAGWTVKMLGDALKEAHDL